MTHRSKFLKSRVEKKIVNQYGDGWCYGCGEDHGKETRVESVRRRRVDSEIRRVKRRKFRQSPLSFREFNEVYQLELYASIDRKIKTFWPVDGVHDFAEKLVPQSGVSLNYIREFYSGFLNAKEAEKMINWVNGDA